ncbi:polysaccharide biosynthesis tyrosine autokinase [Ewingella americana]|uniref:polysaccharide biosynthesis tyrosine autokinase n=1 Tax=Ewingella americana TaxID=41202 RepID=UPI001639D465|nr:polysaccharide biosynthesis tyrosine autokinase [Ewingella americana]QMV50377.1 polysaccharide biosynthesis tyrosine autokinase [Ewingella americana]
MLAKGVPHQDVHQENDVDLRYILGVLIDAKRMLIGIVLAGFLLGSLLIWSMPAVYKADALIQLDKSTSSSLLNGIFDFANGNASLATTEITLIKSRSILGNTVSALGLDNVVREEKWPLIGGLFPQPTSRLKVPILTLPEQMQGQPFTLTLMGSNRFHLQGEGVSAVGEVGKELTLPDLHILVHTVDAPVGSTFIIKKISQFAAMEAIDKNLTVVETSKDSGVLRLSLTGTDRVLIRQILDKLSIGYLKQNIERKSESASKSLDFLQRQLPEIESRLEKSEASLSHYRRQNESIDLPLEARAILEAEVAVTTQLNSLTFEEAELSKRFTNAHPAYRALDEKRKTLLANKAALELKINAMPKTQQNILRLTRDVQTAQEMHSLLIGKQREMEIKKVSTVGNVHIIDPAQTLPHPVGPKRTMLLVLALLCSSFLALGVVLLRNALKRGISSSHELELLGLKVYSSLPHSEHQSVTRLFRAKKNLPRKHSLLAIEKPDDLAVEAIRSLRTGLYFLLKEANNKILMVVGPTSGVGKSFVISNLAVVLAQSNLRVLLVDCDMRKGCLHLPFKLKEHRGLAELLSGQKKIAECLYKTCLAQLDLVPRGIAPSNPSELLLTPRFAEFCDWATKNYDVVLFDTPPILAVSDAAIISKYAGTSLMVARFEMTSAKEIELAMQRFEQQEHTITGVVLNSVEPRVAQYYQYGHFENYQYKSDAN